MLVTNWPIIKRVTKGDQNFGRPMPNGDQTCFGHLKLPFDVMVWFGGN